MNLLLVDAHEVTGDTCALRDRRAAHLRAVIGARVGSAVRAGIAGGGLGTATVIADDGEALTLRLAITEPAPAPLPVELVLAVPRPKVLARTLEIAASFGVARVALTNAWRVDKSYLASPRLAPAALAAAVRLGAEQGATTHLPEVAVARWLMELLDGRDWRAAGRCLIAHPGAPPIEAAFGDAPGGDAPGGDAPVTLAIGPEGGWIARELDTFAARGFTAVSLGAPILRVEAAVAAALGQLVLLRRLRAS